MSRYVLESRAALGNILHTPIYADTAVISKNGPVNGTRPVAPYAPEKIVPRPPWAPWLVSSAMPLQNVRSINIRPELSPLTIRQNGLAGVTDFKE